MIKPPAAVLRLDGDPLPLVEPGYFRRAQRAAPMLTWKFQNLCTKVRKTITDRQQYSFIETTESRVRVRRY